MGNLITSCDLVYLFRILLAMVAGGVIGYEREYHVKVAGLRTHILIAMASALMMIISKYAFYDVLTEGYPGLGLDVSRVAAGIIAGMGIFSGGIVFIGKRGNVSGLTTAAGIWATIGIGMVIGAGMYTVGIGSVILVELVQLLLRHDLSVYRHGITVMADFEIENSQSDYNRVVNSLESDKVKLSSIKWNNDDNGKTMLRIQIEFDKNYKRDEVVSILNRIEGIRGFELL